MKLYEISEGFMRLAELAEDPEVDAQVIADTMEALDGDFEEKADGAAKVIASLKAQAEAVEKEMKRLSDRKKALENNAERIKTNLQTAMESTGKRKFKTNLFSFNIQKNPPKVIMEQKDVWSLPQEFIKYKDPEINTTAVGKALKEGRDLTGIAHFEQSEGLRIR